MVEEYPYNFMISQTLFELPDSKHYALEEMRHVFMGPLCTLHA